MTDGSPGFAGHRRGSRRVSRADNGRRAANRPTLKPVNVGVMLPCVEQQPADDFSLLSALTTEHFVLQSARSSMITESLGRTTIYLGSLSATLVALALVVQGDTTEDDVRLFALILLPALIFLGTVTFVRVLENSIEDTMYVMAINRIRRFYLEHAGENARYFALSGHDDLEGAYANMGLASSRWRPFFSVAAVLALINSMVTGALAGIALDAFAPREIALVAGGLITGAAFFVHYRAGWSRYARAIRRQAPLFPSGS